eukprot:3466962-Rhodomonas_salina.2
MTRASAGRPVPGIAYSHTICEYWQNRTLRTATVYVSTSDRERSRPRRRVGPRYPHSYLSTGNCIANASAHAPKAHTKSTYQKHIPKAHTKSTYQKHTESAVAQRISVPGVACDSSYGGGADSAWTGLRNQTQAEGRGEQGDPCTEILWLL